MRRQLSQGNSQSRRHYLARKRWGVRWEDRLMSMASFGLALAAGFIVIDDLATGG
jgi:hypothetical protein